MLFYIFLICNYESARKLLLLFSNIVSEGKQVETAQSVLSGLLSVVESGKLRNANIAVKHVEGR